MTIGFLPQSSANTTLSFLYYFVKSPLRCMLLLNADVFSSFVRCFKTQRIAWSPMHKPSIFQAGYTLSCVDVVLYSLLSDVCFATHLLSRRRYVLLSAFCLSFSPCMLSAPSVFRYCWLVRVYLARVMMPQLCALPLPLTCYVFFVPYAPIACGLLSLFCFVFRRGFLKYILSVLLFVVVLVCLLCIIVLSLSTRSQPPH